MRKLRDIFAHTLNCNKCDDRTNFNTAFRAMFHEFRKSQYCCPYFVYNDYKKYDIDPASLESAALGVCEQYFKDISSNKAENEILSFGEYLLSDERNQSFTDHPENGVLPDVQNRIKSVTDADLKNWKHVQKNNNAK